MAIPRIVRTKVVGLAWRGNSLLACEIKDDVAGVTGVRPPGGSIEFGETRDEALKREFLEEFGAVVKIVGPWQTFENIFDYLGARGHEFIFAANIEFIDAQIYDREALHGIESDGTQFAAQWFPIERFRDNELALYPKGLWDFLATKATPSAP